LKYVGGRVKSRVSGLIKRIWQEERMPQQWRNTIIYPIPKIGDRKNCDNYRGILLLDVTYKVLIRIIRNRLSLFDDTLIGEYQGGFRKGRPTTNQVFISCCKIKK
jgi:hypothetical protein